MVVYRYKTGISCLEFWLIRKRKLYLRAEKPGINPVWNLSEGECCPFISLVADGNLQILIKAKKIKKTCYRTYFFIWLVKRKGPIFAPLSWKQSFYLKKKLIPIENWKRDFVKSSVFFCSILGSKKIPSLSNVQDWFDKEGIF